MCQVKFKHMIVLVNLILTTTLGDITGFCKTCFQKTETGAYRNQVTTHHNSCKESDTTERLGFTSLDSIIPWLASGRSGVHLMLAHSEMDPGMSPACHEQFMSLVASLELSHMFIWFIDSYVHREWFQEAWTCSRISRVIHIDFQQILHSILIYRGLSKLVGTVGSIPD